MTFVIPVFELSHCNAVTDSTFFRVRQSADALIFPAADEFQPLFCGRKEIICIFAASNTETKRMSTVAMNELWAYLKSLSLSAGNKAWLAERLIESSRADKLAEADEFACFSGSWGDDMPVNEYAESLRCTLI